MWLIWGFTLAWRGVNSIFSHLEREKALMSSPAEAPLMIVAEPTPNPNSVKFKVNRVLLDGLGREFASSTEAECSPLARELFLINGVSSVYIGGDFVTVSMGAENIWAMRPLVEGTIETHLAAGKPVIANLAMPTGPAPIEGLSMIEMGIMRVLDTEIRPAVAMDGGDIVFSSYKDGVLKVHLRGACHHCPSATFTLKAGIESRLKREFPEILCVEAV
jgi:Fe-S cluster biogenesis protein NfuA